MKSLGRETELSSATQAHAFAPTPPADDADEFAQSPGVNPEADEARPLAPARWDWTEVRRVLVVRLRSIGDTVLATPSLHALRRFLPRARVDVLLEDWVAPLLEGSQEVDRVIRLERGQKLLARVQMARGLRAERYDVAFNLHGGSTASLLT